MSIIPLAAAALVMLSGKGKAPPTAHEEKRREAPPADKRKKDHKGRRVDARGSRVSIQIGPKGRAHGVSRAEVKRRLATLKHSIDKALKIARVKAEATDPKAVAAATELAGYLKRGGRPGSKAAPAPGVSRLQRIMGGIAADGVVGSETRARAVELGVVLPPPRRGSGTKLVPVTPVPKKPGQGTPGTVGIAPKDAAEALKTFLEAAGLAGMGTRAKPSPDVAKLQRAMGGLKADGVYGRVTQARAAALGVQIPPRPRSSSSSPARVPVEPAAVSMAPADAATALGRYFGSGGSPGTRQAPDKVVKQAQAAMGKLKVDGLYGDVTQKRAAALGVTLPSRAAVIAALKGGK
jgi:hypothetical protein